MSILARVPHPTCYLRSTFSKFLLRPVIKPGSIAGKMPLLGFDQQRCSFSIMRLCCMSCGTISSIYVFFDFSLYGAQGANNVGSFSCCSHIPSYVVAI